MAQTLVVMMEVRLADSEREKGCRSVQLQQKHVWEENGWDETTLPIQSEELQTHIDY